MHETERPNRRWRKGGLVLAALLVLGVIGAVAKGGSNGSGDRAMVMMDSQLEKSSGGDAASSASSGAVVATASALRAGGGGSDSESAAAPAPAQTAGVGSLPTGLGAPKVVKTATLGVEVKKGTFGNAFSEAASIAAANGGFVSSSTSRMATGTLVVRVPAEKFDETRRQLGGLGKITEEQIEGVDMSGALADIGARLVNLTTQEQAIRLIMDKAKTIGETIQVQEQLTQVREQIERLTAEQARLNDAVALSTLTVSVSEPGLATGNENDEPSPLADSLAKAFHGAQVVIGGLIVSLGYLLPLALVAGFVWLVTSRRRATAVPAA